MTTNQQASKPIEFERGGHVLRLEVRRYATEHVGLATIVDIVAALSANPELTAACADGLSRHTGELRERAEAAEAELERQNDTAYDATDGAHPAWWRGHDNGVKGMAERVASLQARLDVVREDRRLQRVRATDAEIALDKLQAQLREREEELARLRLNPQESEEFRSLLDAFALLLADMVEALAKEKA